MGRSLAWRDRLVSAAVGAAVASILVPAEAHAPASLGAAGQFNLFPYNTSYNRNSASLGQLGATLRTTRLADDAASQYVGRGSLREMFGDRFLSRSSGSRFHPASSHKIGSGLLSGDLGSRTIFASGKPGSSVVSVSSVAGNSNTFARRAGSGSVGVVSGNSTSAMYYASASQVAAVTSLDTGLSPSNSSAAWSDKAGSGSGAGGVSAGESGGHTAFTVSNAGAVRGGAASGASVGGNSAHTGTTRTVSLSSLNGSLINTGSGSANTGQAAGSSFPIPGTNNSGTGNGAGNVSVFPDAPPQSVVTPAPVPEPGILVTTLSLLAVTGLGLLRGRLRRA